jgi:hypothetical protein
VIRSLVLLFAGLLAVPGTAQHDITKVDPAPPQSAISTPLPEKQERRLKKYEIQELAGARQALGSQLIDGRLPKPLIDFVTHEGSVEQRLSVFEGGLVVVAMTGAASIRKKVLIPGDALDAYLGAISPDGLQKVDARSLAVPERGRTARLRVYRDDGSHVERIFHPGRVLPKSLGDQLGPLRDLLRAVSEDRSVTSSVAGYEPQIGDELVADDHKVYRVERLIGGAGVVELRCLDAPATIYVMKSDLHLYFIGRRPQ